MTVQTYRRMVLDILGGGETLSTGEVMSRIQAMEDPRHVPDTTAYKTLQKLHRAGEVDKEIREEPGKTSGAVKLKAYWRISGASR